MHAYPPQRMTVDAFLVWAMAQPEGRRFELVNGTVVVMAPEPVLHAATQAAVWLALCNAIRAAEVGCAVEVPDPLIVVEVVSPSSAGTDRGAKLEGYFRLASVRHDLIVLTEPKRVIHHERTDDGTLRTRILGDGPLDPPGLSLDVVSLFEG